MRLAFLAVFIFISFAFDEHPSITEGQIRWSANMQLTLQDFEGAVPLNTSWGGATYSAINLSYMDYGGHIRDISCYAFFDKNQSWMKDTAQCALEHEQLHFNITELFARQLYGDLKKFSAQQTLSVNEVSRLFKQCNDACNQMQDDYDDDTNHGADAQQQKWWSEQVAILLKQYAPCQQQ